MDEVEFKERTKQAALRIIRVVETLPERGTAGIIGKHLLRSGTSVVAQEAPYTIFWSRPFSGRPVS